MNKSKNYFEIGFERGDSLPQGWKIFRVGNIFKERSEKVDDITYPPLSVTMSGIVNQLSDVAKTKDNKNRKLVKKNDFVINSRSDRKGSSGISPRDGSVSQINIVLKSKGIDSQYVQHLFKSYYFKEEFFRSGKGIHWDLWTTHWDQFKSINILVPLIKEQKLISRFLDKKTKQINLLIEKTKKKIELLKEQRVALINQCATKGLDPNVEMKDSGVEWIGKFPKHWGTKRLKFLANHITDKCLPKKGDVKISPENVESHTGIITNYYSDYKLKGYVFIEGDILFNKLRVYLNKVVYCDFKGLSMGEMIVIRSSNISSLYLHKVLNSQKFIDYVDSLSEGVKLPRASVKYILNSFIPLPTENEQIEISDYIFFQTTKLDKQVRLENKRIVLLTEYRQALVSSVVTGKVRVAKDMI